MDADITAKHVAFLSDGYIRDNICASTAGAQGQSDFIDGVFYYLARTSSDGYFDQKLCSDAFRNIRDRCIAGPEHTHDGWYEYDGQLYQLLYAVSNRMDPFGNSATVEAPPPTRTLAPAAPPPALETSTFEYIATFEDFADVPFGRRFSQQRPTPRPLVLILQLSLE